MIGQAEYSAKGRYQVLPTAALSDQIRWDAEVGFSLAAFAGEPGKKNRLMDWTIVLALLFLAYGAVKKKLFFPPELLGYFFPSLFCIKYPIVF